MTIGLAASKCMDCANAVPQFCPWIATGDKAGLVYKTRQINIENTLRGHVYTRHLDLYTITDCVRFAEGELPPAFGEIPGTWEGIRCGR